MAAPTRAATPLATSADGGALIESGTYDADADIPFAAPYQAAGVVVVIHLSAETEAGASIVFTLQGRDAVSGQVWAIANAVTVTEVGVSTIQVHPALRDVLFADDTAIAGRGNNVVPPLLNLNINHADGKDVVYSVAAYFTH